MPTEEQKKLWKMIKPIKVGMLSTRSRGKIHSRPMALVQDEFNGRLYFFTRDDSLKVAETNEEEEVGVSFSDPDEQNYVSLSGKARLSRDRKLINQFWSPLAKAYFPDGKDDPHLALLEIDVDAAEFWDADKSRMVQFFKMAKAKMQNETPDLGERRRVG